MKGVLAVSGGVDSMVMLDLYGGEGDFVVAHFDHGIRDESKEDVELVRREAERKGLKFVLGERNLGKRASEDAARRARYDFLFSLGGEVWTAHHIDDMVETGVINIIRGTGWRGLAPFVGNKVQRPFIDQGWGRKEVLEHAAKHGVKWRQDATNYSGEYLRGRIRERSIGWEGRDEFLRLTQCQRVVRKEIDALIYEVVQELDLGKVPREWLKSLDDLVLREILYAVLQEVGVRPLPTDLERLVEGIRDLSSGKKVNLSGGKLVNVNRMGVDFIA